MRTLSKLRVGRLRGIALPFRFLQRFLIASVKYQLKCLRWNAMNTFRIEEEEDWEEEDFDEEEWEEEEEEE